MAMGQSCSDQFEVQGTKKHLPHFFQSQLWSNARVLSSELAMFLLVLDGGAAAAAAAAES